MKGRWRIGCISLIGIVLIIGVGLWLNLPTSLFLLARTTGERGHPVKFDLWYGALPKTSTSAEITINYMPKTPILGISQHFWSIIAPMRIDQVVQRQHVAERGGHFRFDVPLGLAGLSGYRLSLVRIHLNGMHPQDAADVGVTTTPDNKLPVTLSIPLSHVQGGEYEFGGPMALWRRSGALDDPTGYTFSPRAPSETRQVIWDDVTQIRALIDLTHYPVPSFQPPADWQGLGWKLEGGSYSRPGATLTERALDMRRNTTLRIPFTRDCSAAPWFVTIPANQIPAWSKINGLWRPVPQGYWLGMMSKPGLAPHFIATAKPADGIEAVELHATLAGSFRLFATCVAEHYGSTAMAWLDVNVH